LQDRRQAKHSERQPIDDVRNVDSKPVFYGRVNQWIEVDLYDIYGRTVGLCW
jgi:hypothetical protein